jgi:hypothetical protein
VEGTLQIKTNEPYFVLKRRIVKLLKNAGIQIVTEEETKKNKHLKAVIENNYLAITYIDKTGNVYTDILLPIRNKCY